ncbi:hypothetical protein ScPMuIL_003023, partial [Solemya velum]
IQHYIRENAAASTHCDITVLKLLEENGVVPKRCFPEHSGVHTHAKQYLAYLTYVITLRPIQTMSSRRLLLHEWILMMMMQLFFIQCVTDGGIFRYCCNLLLRGLVSWLTSFNVLSCNFSALKTCMQCLCV